MRIIGLRPVSVSLCAAYYLEKRGEMGIASDISHTQLWPLLTRFRSLQLLWCLVSLQGTLMPLFAVIVITVLQRLQFQGAVYMPPAKIFTQYSHLSGLCCHLICYCSALLLFPWYHYLDTLCSTYTVLVLPAYPTHSDSVIISQSALSLVWLEQQLT